VTACGLLYQYLSYFMCRCHLGSRSPFRGCVCLWPPLEPVARTCASTRMRSHAASAPRLILYGLAGSAQDDWGVLSDMAEERQCAAEKWRAQPRRPCGARRRSSTRGRETTERGRKAAVRSRGAAKRGRGGPAERSRRAIAAEERRSAAEEALRSAAKDRQSAAEERRSAAEARPSRPSTTRPRHEQRGGPRGDGQDAAIAPRGVHAADHRGANGGRSRESGVV
jgi:hypothetical protein